MPSRRQLLLTAASTALFPGVVAASSGVAKKRSWPAFQQQMAQLADAGVSGGLDQKVIAERGMQYLKQLDIHSPEFKQAVAASYESGNRYWLWQRLIKGQNLNGGILNIDSDQLVQLHDHPGATGMIRIISGEVEAWQFDETRQSRTDEARDVVELKRFSRHILKVGDTAVLTPDRGNVHALRSITKKCRMLDFFIPPYLRSERHWYEPLAGNWFEQKTITCKKIPQQAFARA